MKLSVKKNTLIKITIIIILGGLELWFITLPNIQEIKSIQNDISRQFEDVDRQLTKGQTMRKLKEDLEKIDPFLTRLDSIFVIPAQQLEFIVALEELAIQENVETNLTLGNIPTNSKNNFITVPLDIRIDSTFKNFVEYLTELQKFNFYININTINISAQSQTDKINSALKGITYWKTDSL